jgi:transposase InsO family protein
MDEIMRERIALFRYSVIGPLISSELAHGELREQIRALCQRRYTIPNSRRTHVCEGTVLDWLYSYRSGGLEALKPKPRADAGSTRAIPPEIAPTILAMKQKSSKISANTIIKQLVDKGIAMPRQLAPATVYRFLRHNLPKRPPSKTGKTQRRFVHRFPNDCWQADTMHGPYIKTDDARKPRKTYLIAFIDDATRLIVGAQFFFAETIANVKTVLRQALLTYGVPRKLYLDNGPCFRAEELQIACATINCALIHATPYYPQAKGKIERFFRSVQSRFIPCMPAVHSIEQLNEAFHHWLHADYNLAPHRGIGNATPRDTFLNNAEGHIRPFPSNIDPIDLFCKRASRRVDKLATFSVNAILYQTQEHLIGMTIDIRYDPDDPTRKVRVFHQGVFVHNAYPVSFNDNAAAKRRDLRP